MELSPLCFLQYLTHQLSQFCEEITIHTLGSKLDICLISAQRALPNNVLPAITYKFLPAVYDGQFEAKSTSSYKNVLLHSTFSWFQRVLTVSLVHHRRR